MVPAQEMKQRLLREAVQDNTGHRPSPTYRELPTATWRRRRPRLFLLSFVRVPVLCVSICLLLVLDPTYNVTHVLPFASRLFRDGLPERGVLLPDMLNDLRLVPKLIDFRVFPIGVQTILLDPGHGGKDGGAAGLEGMLEKVVTLDIALRLRTLLEGAAFKVIMTRESDKTIATEERVALANSRGADLFVSIHANWFKMPATQGVETYYLGPTDDPHVLQLAALENRGATHTLGDLHRLLEDVYLNVRRRESRELAQAVQVNMTDSLRGLYPNLVDRGVKMAPFLVLAGTKMPAILAEVSFLSNQEEARLLATGEYRQGIAQALFQGIRAYTKTLNHTAKRGS